MVTVCRICLRPAEQVRNPFHGTGLAVHEYLIDCRTCGLASVEQKAFEALVPTTVVIARYRLRSFFWRLISRH